MNLLEQLALLNAETAAERLENIRRLIAGEKEKPKVLPQYANNHIHSIYSFSPYSPTAAVWMARAAGLETAGIMDHDTIAGAEEFRCAGKIAGVAVTCGMECRADLSETALGGKKLNSPDQSGIAYMAIHSVPRESFSMLQAAFSPLRARRNERNRKMTENIGARMAPWGVTLDFDKDVLPESQYAAGGTVTERHLMWALAGKLLAAYGGPGTGKLLADMGAALPERQRALLTEENPHLRYDLLGILKAGLLKQVYVPATDECMPFRQLVRLCGEAGAILCYPYLGDVGDSVTGDKKPEKFEDGFLDTLFDVMHREGVEGVTYMPSRNTDAQISRLRALSARYTMFEISGEDVNSPKQSFICKKLGEPGFFHLVDATWRLVERER